MHLHLVDLAQQPGQSILPRHLHHRSPAELEVHLAFADLDAWYDISLIANHDSNGRVTSLIGAAVDVTERKQTEAHIRLLMREIAHRAKNILTVVLAMTRQTAAGATSANNEPVAIERTADNASSLVLIMGLS